MGIPGKPLYGDVDLGSAIEDVEKIIKKIKTNKFGKKDIIDLYNANTDVVAAALSHDYED